MKFLTRRSTLTILLTVAAILVLYLYQSPLALATDCAANPWTAGGKSFPSIDTGLGCMPIDAEGMTKWTVKTVVGVAGGIALLMLIIGGVQFVSSSGDPDAIEEARGKITSALAGLILIIFSILIMKIIGIDVLGLPNLTPSGGGGINLP